MTTIKNEIIEAEKALLEAMKTDDINALDLLLHNDLLFVAFNGQLVTKQIDLDSHRAKMFELHKMEQSEQVVKIIGETVTVSVLATIEGSFSGQPVKQTLRYVRVWQKYGAQWQVIAGSCVEVK